jgi:hypothetical protein
MRGGAAGRRGMEGGDEDEGRSRRPPRRPAFIRGALRE